MGSDVLEKVNQLPLDKQQEVEDFINLLWDMHRSASEEQVVKLIALRRRNLGRLKGKIWTANDFHETPDDFKEYL